MQTDPPAVSVAPARFVLPELRSAGLASIVAPFALVFLGGIAVTILQSVGLVGPGGGPGDGPSLEAYRRVFSSPGWAESLGFSLSVALSSAAISTLLGAVGGYAVWRLPPRLKRAAGVYKVPLVLPHITIAFVFLVLFSQTGFFSSLLHRIGLIADYTEFPDLIYRRNGIVLTLAYIFKETPFVILLILSALRSFDRRLVTTGKLLGGSEARIFRKIVVPFIAPAMQAIFAILLVYGFGAFDIPYILGRTRPAMMGVHIYDLYFSYGFSARNEASAMLVLMLIVALVLLGILSILFVSTRKPLRRNTAENPEEEG